MTLFDSYVPAILKAQYRVMVNRMGRSAVVFTVFSLLWYGLVALGAWGIAVALPNTRSLDALIRITSGGLLLAFLAWQIIPLMLVSAGVTLDLRRLLVYPIPPSRLFAVEVLLRLTTGAEVAILLCGGAIGLWLHPRVPWWGPLFILPFALLNMLLSAGIRDLLTRLMARRGIRELVILGFVMMMALPQVFVTMAQNRRWKFNTIAAYFDKIPAFPWPWQVTANLATGSASLFDLAGLAFWVTLGSWFGYWQFQRGLRFDADEVRAKERSTIDRMPVASWREALYRLPSRLLPDPLGAIVEKEVRSLTRAPRFRLMFFMGFTFGLIIWLPLLMRGGSNSSVASGNFLIWVTLYATLLLGDVLFFNVFGFDRKATQAWYILPVSPAKVLMAKNITAVVFLLLEVGAVAAVCALFQLPVTGQKVIECLAVSLLFCLFLLAAGNMVSTRYPRPVNPEQSWRNSGSGKAQFILFLLYPIIGLPIALAYLARYAFGTEFAFYAVLASGFIIAAMTYYVAMQSAVDTAYSRREEILAALAQNDGPMGG